MNSKKIYSRALKQYIGESEPADNLVHILYETFFGRVLLKLIFARPWFSRLYALTKRTKRSANQIAPFVEKYNIDMSKCEKKAFDSFEDFFTRKTVFLCAPREGFFYSAAQAKLTAVEITDDCRLKIKGVVYSLAELLQDAALAKKYHGGICLIYRLSLTDSHRYIFSADGVHGISKAIKGVLHTVRPISQSYRVFAHNARKWSVLHTPQFKDILQIEIGAMLVGKTVETHKSNQFKALEEKGYFEYGGSTIVQCFEKNAIILDDDLQSFFSEDIEVQVQIGEKIGCVKKT